MKAVLLNSNTIWMNKSNTILGMTHAYESRRKENTWRQTKSVFLKCNDSMYIVNIKLLSMLVLLHSSSLCSKGRLNSNNLKLLTCANASDLPYMYPILELNSPIIIKDYEFNIIRHVIRLKKQSLV